MMSAFAAILLPPKFAAALLCGALTFSAPGGEDVDSDRDGLSDFQEIHKYRTNPTKRDSDDDGTPDGDWNERREYTYTIRTVLRVMPPINEAAISDDYQDARVRKKTKRYVELEVIHYPLSTAQEMIAADPDWRKNARRMADYVKPGITTNWDARMRRHLLEALAKDGIDPHALTDKQVVEKVSDWILRRTKAHDNFNVFHVYYPDGKPTVYPGQEASVDSDKTNPDWTVQEQFEHEILGRQMYYNQARGTCTSTAVLMTTVMRAVGIPTRMIICTPMVDGSGGDNIELVRKGLTHHVVRRVILHALERLEGANASHTFNEVFVGDRWRRLNYSKLGQGILDRNLFGLITHVHTFNDLSDANLAPTWGAREPDDVFRYANAYTALEVSDLFGRHSEIPNPPLTQEAGLVRLTISKVRWLQAGDLPKNINREGFKRDGSGHLFLHADKPQFGADFDDYSAFYKAVGKEFKLVPKDHPSVRARAERGFWIDSSSNCREFYVRIEPREMKKLKAAVAYRLETVESEAVVRWIIAKDVKIAMPDALASGSGLSRLTITKVRWLAAEDLPDCINREKFAADGSGHLFLHAERPAFDAGFEDYGRYYEKVAKEFTLESRRKPKIRARAERGFWIDPGEDCREFYVRIPPEQMKKMKPGAAYQLKTAGKSEPVRWIIASDVTIIRE